MTARSGHFLFLVIAATSLPRIALAGDLRIYAAGSLTAAFTEIVNAFPAPPGSVAPPVFGPSGLLREKIEQGASADILASADMAQPRTLAASHPGRFVVMFARNRMCALAKASLGLTPDNLLDRLLDPSVRLATSTPGADPSGDYAWAVFARSETIRPGARATLEGKALKLVGGPNTPPLVPDHGAVQGVFLADRADVMLSYCSGSQSVVPEVPGLVSVALPTALAVGAAYGLIVLTDQPLAASFALFVMSEQGQAILQLHGFDPVALPPP
jgi:ABC-type molybdate transport system substrate-binding protein